MRARQSVTVVLLPVCGLVVMGAAAQASIIDDFSSDTSAKYNAVETFNPGPGSGGRYEAFGVADNQFAPSGWGVSNYWLRNDGYMMNVGATASINVLAVPASDQAAGLGINQSLTSGSNDHGYFFQYRPYLGGTGMTWNTNTLLSDFDTSFSHGPATITLTRTSATSLNYSADYYKTDGSLAHLAGTDTITTGTYYFGMFSFSCGGARWDNLAQTVPEPSTVALLVTGLIGLVAYGWRKRK